MKILYALLCLLVGTTQTIQADQTLSILTNSLTQSRFIQSAEQNQTLPKLIDVASPIAQTIRTAAAGLGGFCAAGAFTLWLLDGWKGVKLKKTINYEKELPGDQFTKLTDKTLKKLLPWLTKSSENPIHILDLSVGARFLPTSLFLDAIIFALNFWPVQNHHLNTAVESALIPLVCVAVFQRYIAAFSLYAATKQKRYLLSAIPGTFATTLLCKRPNVMTTSFVTNSVLASLTLLSKKK